MKIIRLITIFFCIILTLNLQLNAEGSQPNTEKKVNITKENSPIEPSSLVFVTDKGTEVKAKTLVCGLLRKMEKGEKYVVSYTSSNKPIYAQKWSRPQIEWGNDVPIIDGYIFGAFINFTPFPEGESIQIDIVDTLPKPIMIDNKEISIMKQTFFLKIPEKRYPLVTVFKKSEPQFMQEGIWKKEFYNNGKLIFSYSFELKNPTEEELARNQVYEEYLKESQKSLAPKPDEKESSPSQQNKK